MDSEPESENIYDSEEEIGLRRSVIPSIQAAAAFLPSEHAWFPTREKSKAPDVKNE